MFLFARYYVLQCCSRKALPRLRHSSFYHLSLLSVQKRIRSWKCKLTTYLNKLFVGLELFFQRVNLLAVIFNRDPVLFSGSVQLQLMILRNGFETSNLGEELLPLLVHLLLCVANFLSKPQVLLHQTCNMNPYHLNNFRLAVRKTSAFGRPQSAPYTQCMVAACSQPAHKFFQLFGIDIQETKIALIIAGGKYKFSFTRQTAPLFIRPFAVS